MAIYFFDSSAIVKRYVPETGSAWVQSVTDPAAGNLLYVARITGAEVVSAITRRQKRGQITAAEARPNYGGGCGWDAERLSA